MQLSRRRPRKKQYFPSNTRIFCRIVCAIFNFEALCQTGEFVVRKMRPRPASYFATVHPLRIGKHFEMIPATCRQQSDSVEVCMAHKSAVAQQFSQSGIHHLPSRGARNVRGNDSVQIRVKCQKLCLRINECSIAPNHLPLLKYSYAYLANTRPIRAGCFNIDGYKIHL
jgi:hypothetical protein